MKKWLYGVGLLLLPISYIGLMLLTEQPVDWWVLGLMALIVMPILLLLFSGKIAVTNALSNQANGDLQANVTEIEANLTPATRLAGIGMVVVATACFAGNYVLAKILGLYFPFVLLPVGPLLTMGILAVVHPCFLEVFVAKDGNRFHWFTRLTSYFFLVTGVLLGVLLWISFRGNSH